MIPFCYPGNHCDNQGSGLIRYCDMATAHLEAPPMHLHHAINHPVLLHINNKYFDKGLFLISSAGKSRSTALKAVKKKNIYSNFYRLLINLCEAGIHRLRMEDQRWRPPPATAAIVFHRKAITNGSDTNCRPTEKAISQLPTNYVSM